MAGGSVARPPPKAGDLSQFDKISEAAPMVMGPSSVFTKKDIKRDSSSNMFSMLSQNPELAVDTTAKCSRPPSRKPSVDLGQGGATELHQRKKIQLLPCTIPTPAEETPPNPSEDESEAPAQMSEADAKKKIDEYTKELFAVRSMEEADVYFTNLPEEHRFRLVDKLVASALESKVADAVLVAEFFAQAASKGQCSPEVFEAGFMPMAKLLDDVAIDAPNAVKFMAIMLRGAGFDKDEERLARLAGKSMYSDKLLQFVSSCDKDEEERYLPFVPGIRPEQGADGLRLPAFPRAVPNDIGTPPQLMAGPVGPTSCAPKAIVISTNAKHSKATQGPVAVNIEDLEMDDIVIAYVIQPSTAKYLV